jgi:hypothetical protein
MTRVARLFLAAAAWLVSTAPASSQEHVLELGREFHGTGPAAAGPVPAPAVVERDAAAAAEAAARRARDERALREAVPQAPRRPDLTPDIAAGIQARRLQETLGRR